MGFPGGMNTGGVTLPTIAFVSPGVLPSTPSGSSAGAAVAFNVTGGSWSLVTTGPFAINAATGAVLTTGAVSAQDYAVAVSYTWVVVGMTYEVTVNSAIHCSTVLGPTLDFSDPNNSQFIGNL